MKMQTAHVRHIGVGIDTARYGHRVSYLRDDRQPAAKSVTITENQAGYQQLRHDLTELRKKYPEAQFHVHLDAAGLYAVNLEQFLRSLDIPLTISFGEPKRNKDYHAAVSPKRTTDQTESIAMARFGVVEQPQPAEPVPAEFAAMREVTGQLQGLVKDQTRNVNRLHNLLARVFPELSTLVDHLDASAILTLLNRFPTPQCLTDVPVETLKEIPYLRKDKAAAIHAAARQSVGSLQGPFAQRLVRQLVEAVQHNKRHIQAFEQTLEEAFQTLPATGFQQVQTIPGIGTATAAVLVAKMVDIRRFATPEKLVGYFGIFPQESSSGVDKSGAARQPGKMCMSPKGCDLVRRYLWNAAKSAIHCNPPVKALYHRLRARGIRGDVALGHCMRKLLHQVFAVWVTNQPFHPGTMQTVAPNAAQEVTASQEGTVPQEPDGGLSDSGTETTAGHNREGIPDRTVVTAVASRLEPVSPALDESGATLMPTSRSVPVDNTTASRRPSIDFSYVKEQINLDTLLRHLGIRDQFAGQAQLRGPCPICQSSSHRSLSINVTKNIFRCFNPQCTQGNVLDFWSSIRRLEPHDAACDLVEQFRLQIQRPC